MNSELLELVRGSNTPWLIGLAVVAFAWLSYHHWERITTVAQTWFGGTPPRTKVVCCVNKTDHRPLSDLKVLFVKTGERRHTDEVGALLVEESLWGTQITLFGPD